MAPPSPKVSKRWIPIGLIVIAVGVWMVIEGIDAYRTGQQIHTYHMQTMEWWEQISIAFVTILLGGLVVAVGVGWIKPRGDRPM
jgi:putative Mn2+ efflux pump MntP